ncbi:hypothetical protein PIROE2DRAFT_29779, partial [Piromyces sp. E2]
DSDTPLIWACKNRNENIVKLLIENGVDLSKVNKDGDTPLIWACRMKRENRNDDIAKFLIENGADLNKANKDGNTPLIIACESEHIYRHIVINLLIKNGA